MKKLLLVFLAIALVSGLIFGGCKAPPLAVKPIKLIATSFEGSPGTNMGPLREWAEELKEATEGRVEVEIAYGAVMAPPTEQYDLAVTGVADIAFFSLPFAPGRFPLAEVVQLPLTGEASASCLTTTKAFYELYEKGYFDDEFKDVKVLWFCCAGPYDYHMSKDQPVLSFADMKGKKMRVAGKMHSEIVEALGSVPVGIPAGETYIAMEKGVIDGGFYPFSFLKAFGMASVDKHATWVGVAATTFVFVMNKASYAELPKDIQAIIDDITPKYMRVSSEVHDLWKQESITEFLDAGGEIHTLSEADMEKVWDALAPIWEKWIAEGEAEGLPRKEMVDELYYIFKDLGVEKPFHGYAP